MDLLELILEGNPISEDSRIQLIRFVYLFIYQCTLEELVREKCVDH